MSKRGYLRSNEGVFVLSPKITIVGRESCDFIIQNITVDCQHAVIEFVENEEVFVLKDLNSTHGSYVNDCRVQNAVVRLSEGDVLKFGFSTGQYEFHTENVENIEPEVSNFMSSQYTNLPQSQRQPWQANPNSIPQQGAINQPISFPTINYNQQQPPIFQHRHTINNGGLMSWTQLPKAPTSLRSGRPLSASSLNRRQLTPTAPPPLASSPIYSRKGSISGPAKQVTIDNRISQNDDQKLMQLQMELDRLKPLEKDVIEKSQQIESLIQQNTDMLNSLNDPHTFEIYGQIQCLTEELTNKKKEIDKLQNIVGKIAENNSNRQNSNSSNNDSEMNQVRKDLEIARKDLKISYGLITTLQKDLSNRDESIAKLTRENQNITQELSEKNVSISMLMNKLSRLKDVQEDETEKQDRERELISLRHKTTSMESTALEQNEKINVLTRNNENYQQSDKINTEALRDLNKQLDESKTLIVDLQRSESILRVDIQESEKKFDRFRTRVLQVALSTPGFKSTDQSLKDDELIEMMKELAKSKIEHDRRLCEKQKLIDEANRKYHQLIDDINSYKTKLEECYEILLSGDRTSSRIQEILTLSKSINVCDQLIPLKDVHINNLSNEILFLSGLETCISDAGPELTNLSLSECFKRIIQRSIDAVESKTLAEGRLNQTMESYEETIKRLKQAQREEIEFEIQQILEKERDESEKKFQLAFGELTNNEEQKRLTLTSEFEEKISQYEENIENLKQSLKNKDRLYQEQFDHLNDQIKKNDDQSKHIIELEKQINDVTEKKRILESSICEQLNTVEEKCKSEINLYKEESVQYAITIDSLNDRLIKLNKENTDLKNQITKIKSEKKKSKPVDQNKSDSVPKHDNYVNDTSFNNSTIANLEKCISALRHENVLLKNRISEYEGSMKGLNMDLAGAEARLSDLKGELSESQKNEIDNLKIEIQNLEEECSQLRCQLSKLSGIIDRLTQELSDKKLENTNLNQHLHEARLSSQEKDIRIQDLENQMKHEKEVWIKNINDIEQEGRISNELATLGSQCRGERHSQIIDSQKIALGEMRKKVKTLEMSQIPNTNVPEVTHQMIEMKKELAQLRSRKALQDSAPKGMNSLKDILSLKEKSRRQNMPAITEGEMNIIRNNEANIDSAEQKKLMIKYEFELEMEKTKRIDLQQSVDLSELSYLNLVRQLVSVLDMTDVDVLKTFNNLTPESKDELRIQRDEFCGIIIQKMKILKERIQRKEELLQGYEQDLVKLKQAEDLANKTQTQLENIFQQMRFKGEEVELLRETLNRTKDLLNQEKRTNTAIKKNREYVPENTMTDNSTNSPTPKYHCPLPDVLDKEKILQKNKMEKNKRKDYEIKSLKAELYRKEKELSHATNRLYTLETSMGIKSEEPVS